ncbi:MAG: hypothetical protein Kow006_00310 [Gammaproteobacteria bacterium]
MRILLVEGSGRGFLNQYAHALALGLHEQGHEVDLVTGRRDELAGWSVPFRKRACLPDGITAWLCLAREVARWRPQVVHLQWVNNPWAALLFVRWARARGVHVVYTPHNLLPHRGRWLLMPAYRALYGAVDRIIARDRHIAWGLEELLGVANQQVVSIPGSPNLVAHPDAPRRAIEGLAAREEGEFRLLFFGHGCRRKGLRLLLRWLASRRWPCALHLVVAGEGVLASIAPEALEALSGRVKVSVISRYVEPEEVPELFAQADLLLMPYIKQCKSPLTDLAAGFGLPVLRSDRVEGAWFVEGRHGLTLPHDDPGAWIETLSLLAAERWRLEPLRDKLAKEESVPHAVSRLAQSHDALYRSLAPEHSAAPEASWGWGALKAGGEGV